MSVEIYGETTVGQGEIVKLSGALGIEYVDKETAMSLKKGIHDKYYSLKYIMKYIKQNVYEISDIIEELDESYVFNTEGGTFTKGQLKAKASKLQEYFTEISKCFGNIQSDTNITEQPKEPIDYKKKINAPNSPVTEHIKKKNLGGVE